jgi:hypothetical protein
MSSGREAHLRSFDPGVVKINQVYAALFREIEMLVWSKKDPSPLFFGVIRLMVRFGAAEINVDQLFSYSGHCVECIPDCVSLIEMASPKGRSSVRRALIDHGDFLQLKRFAELSHESLAFKELLEVSETLARRHRKIETEQFLAFVNEQSDLSEFDRRRLTQALRPLNQSTAHRF